MSFRLLLIVLALPSIASAQSYNIDFGYAGTAAPDTYAAAGEAGVWNAVEALGTTWGNPDPTLTYALVDVDGEDHGVTLHQFGGTEIVEGGVPAGEHAGMLGDRLVTHTDGLETCVWIDGLPNGTYEVISYAWTPESDAIQTRVHYDFHDEVIEVGGPWPGGLEEGVTHAVHRVEVTEGTIRQHAGNVAGNDLAIGAPLNGMQIRPWSDAADDDDVADDDDAADDDAADGGSNAGCSVGAGAPSGLALLLLWSAGRQRIYRVRKRV